MYPAQIEQIRRERAEFNKRKMKAGQWGKIYGDGLLRTKTANEWMKQEYSKPAARQLFGSLWLENELCILFADTNMGKSVLAVQIGDCLTKECSFEPFYNQVCEPLKVLYVDFELSAKQFEARYVKGAQLDSYLFSPNFYRSEFNPEADDGIACDNYEQHVQEAISFAVSECKAKVLIIDNITYMGNGTQNANAALPLMKALKALKIKFGLSILVLAHTPKRSAHKPLTVNDLQGSKMLINFADSAFAIGQSYVQPGLRYIKQIKQRNQKEEYGENNICLIRQEKHINFLRYKFEGYAREAGHLAPPSDAEAEHRREKVLELHAAGRSLRQIADELGLHYTSVGRIVRRNVPSLPQPGPAPGIEH
jgi:RecA-family ATPase